MTREIPGKLRAVAFEFSGVFDAPECDMGVFRNTLSKLSARKSCNFGIVTGERRATVDAVLTAHNLGRYFVSQNVISFERIDWYKPSPQGYDQLVDRLRVKPEQMVAVETTAAGIDAAHTAGMYVVALASHRSEAELQRFSEDKAPDQIVANHQALQDLLLS